MTVKLGAHCKGFDAGYTARVKPSVVKLIEGYDKATEFKQSAPGVFVIGRYVCQPPDLADLMARNIDATLAGAEYVSRWVMPHLTHPANRDVDGWEDCNEPLITSLPMMRYFAHWCIGAMRVIRAGGKVPVIGNFSVGTPDLPENDRLAYWEAFDPALRELAFSNGFLGLHEYSGNNPEWSQWLGTRHVWVEAYCRSQNIPLSIIVTECGCDSLPDGTHPWRNNFDGDIITQSAAYTAHLMRWYDAIANDANIFGACLYEFAFNGSQWDVGNTPLIDMLGTELLAHNPPVVIPPPVVEPPMPEIVIDVPPRGDFDVRFRRKEVVPYHAMNGSRLMLMVDTPMYGKPDPKGAVKRTTKAGVGVDIFEYRADVNMYCVSRSNPELWMVA